MGLAIFRVGFAIACLLKFAVETSRGYWHYADHDHFLVYLQRQRGERLIIGAQMYRALYVVKIFAAIALLFGVLSVVASALLVISFLYENRLYFKFHTSLFTLLAGLLMTSPSAGEAFTIWHADGYIRDASSAFATDANRKGSLIPQLAGMATIVVVYLTSAVRKTRSASFRSGHVVHETLRFVLREAPNRRREGWYPHALQRLAGVSDEMPPQRLRVAMQATIAMQFAIPLLLLSPWAAAGVALGVILHLSFECLLPVTLLHFAIAVLSTYVLFLDPQTLAAAIAEFGR